jgi:hypothetical protein
MHYHTAMLLLCRGIDCSGIEVTNTHCASCHPRCLLLLLQVASKDKDFRYMATSDMLNELSKDTFQVWSSVSR